MDSYNLEIKNKEYKKYIDEHIANVFKVYKVYGDKLCERLGIDHERLGDMIKDHDQSKYTSEEFEGYRCHFYPTPEEEADVESKAFRKKKFDSAWLFHLRRNPHHPEFWVYVDDEGTTRCHPMDPMHIAEMILDWAAIGIVFNDTAYEYWSKNGHSKPLHYDSIMLIDKCIDIFKDPIHKD